MLHTYYSRFQSSSQPTAPRGFEPRLPRSKRGVLPLDDRAMTS